MESARQSLLAQSKLRRGLALVPIVRHFPAMINRFAIRLEDKSKDIVSTESARVENWIRDDWQEPRLEPSWVRRRFHSLETRMDTWTRADIDESLVGRVTSDGTFVT